MRVFLLGATPRFDLNLAKDSADRLRMTSGNTGNQLIAYGLMRTIAHEALAWDYGIGPDRVNAEFDVIVVAAANFIYKGFDLAGMADFASRTKLPIVMAGLGAQAPDRTIDIARIPQGTVRLLKIIAERSHSIGVRGTFTADTLDKLGISNSQVLGCPSYYTNGPEGFSIGRKALAPSDPIVVHASRDVIGHSSSPDNMRDLIPRLYVEAARRQGIFVAQTEMEEITIADNRGSAIAASQAARLIPLVRGHQPPASINHWLQNNMRVYWSVEDWIDALKPYGFSLGTRIHGTLAALHAGVPAVCLTHDARTSELCDTLGLSAVDISAVSGELDVDRLFQRYEQDKLDKRYGELLPRYTNFLVANGLKPAWGTSATGSSSS